MVATSDLKCFKTTNFLGGAITGTQINSANPNNIFTNIPKNELVMGEDYYAAVYFKNTHATEAMDNFKLWLGSKTPPADTELKWGFESATGISFDGVDDGINCGDDVTLWSQAKTKFSFSIDVYANNWASGPVGDNIIKHDITSNGRFSLESITSGNNVDFNIRNTGGTYIHAGTATVSTGAWHNLVCTYDNSLGSENMKLYVDSVKVGTASLTDTVTATGDLTIAGNADIETAFDGFVRDYRWWTNKALTQTEVNNVNADLPSAPSPDYWLLMNEGNGDPVDSISGTKTGVLINGANWATPTAQTITDKYSSPVNITWQSLSSTPVNPNVGKLTPSEAFPVWLWLHVNANAEARLDDAGVFAFTFNIPIGGTGSGGTGGGTGGTGGGTGGNPPPTPSDWKIAIVGDEGCETATDNVISLINNQAYDFVVSVGDHAYSGASCWTTRFNPLKSKMNSAYGNHEYSESGGTAPYKTFFGHSLTYFTFQFQNVFFLVFDTNINSDPGSTQHNFMTSELQRVANDNTITWKVGICHHPLYGSGSSHPYNEFNQRQNYHTLFQSNGVSFWLTGHNHNWQRTHQITYNAASNGSPNIVDSTSPYSRTTVGLIHVVSGTGGHDSGSGLYSLGSQPGYQAYQDRTHNGVWEMVASNSGQTLTCSFVATDGSKFDTFTITA